MKFNTPLVQFLLILITAVTLLTSCKTQNLLTERRSREAKPLDSVFRYNPDYEYLIRKDDKISVSVWGQDELSVGSSYGIYNSNEVYGKWLLVDQTGSIELPRYGTFQVEGFRITELKAKLKALFGKWIANPIVDVKVLNKEITVLGEVRNPAVVTVDKDRNTLLEIISKTGGFEFYANLKRVKILRQDGPHVHIANIDLTKSGDFVAANIQLHPGDYVIIPSRKSKVFDKRITTIIPFASTATAAAILMGAL
jgi:polysaccharide biosynthesis/export protein